MDAEARKCRVNVRALFLPQALLQLGASLHKAPECLIQHEGSFLVLGHCLLWALSPTQDPKPAGENKQLLEHIQNLPCKGKLPFQQKVKTKLHFDDLKTLPQNSRFLFKKLH